MQPLVIGLTGGLACGKSTVAEQFKALNIPVIDADEVAREVVAPGEPALDEIRESFGSQVFKPSGELDRACLRRHIFADRRERLRLESILHPKIHACILQALEQLSAPYIILMIPLLLESDHQYPIHRTLVIDIPKELQLKRAAQRDGSDSKTLNGILASQASRDERLSVADDVINNTAGLEELRVRVLQLHLEYLHMAAGMSAMTTPPLQITPDK